MAMQLLTHKDPSKKHARPALRTYLTFNLITTNVHGVVVVAWLTSSIFVEYAHVLARWRWRCRVGGVAKS